MVKNQILLELVPENLLPLSSLEEKLIEAASLGHVISDYKADEPIDTDQISDAQVIRSELLVWLLTDPDVREMIHYKGINIRGAKIFGVLDLEDATIERPLRLRHCLIEQIIVFDRGKYVLLDFTDSQTGSISASSIYIQHDLILSNGFKAKGEINLFSANIGGNLICDGGEFDNPDGFALNGDRLSTAGSVFLRNVKVKGGVNLISADIGSNLECDGGELHNPGGFALMGDRLSTKGYIFLRDGFKSKGEVNLLGANIGSNLECDGGEFDNPNGYALNGDSLSTKGSLFMRNVKAKGEINLISADIGSNLDCDGGEFDNHDGYALNGDSFSAKGSVFLRNVKAKGEINLISANIGSSLECDGGEFDNPDGYALNGDRLSTAGSVFLRNVKVKGGVNLVSTDIGSNLECDGGEFDNPEGYALMGDSLLTKGYVFLRNGFKSKGEVNLLGANIGSNLECDGGEFHNPGGFALNGESLSTNGNVFLRNGFKAKGEVNLISANIGSSLGCDGGEFDNPDSYALYGDSLSTKGSVFLRDGFKAKGEVNLLGANIGGDLNCRQASYSTESRKCFIGDNMKVDGSFIWKNLIEKPTKIVSLEYVQLTNMEDEKESWPTPGNLRIDGLTYGPFSSDVPADSESRLEWLKLRPAQDTSVQPYEQLIKVFREMGLSDDARDIAVAKQRAIRGQLRGLSRFWSLILDITIDYGYRPEKVIVLFIIPIIIIGYFVFNWAYSIGAMLSDTNLAFYPWAYSLDVFLPIVDLHQESAWSPNTAVQYGNIIQFYMYFQILAGWFFTTLAVAAVTGLVRSD